MMTTRIWKLF